MCAVPASVAPVVERGPRWDAAGSDSDVARTARVASSSPSFGSGSGPELRADPQSLLARSKPSAISRADANRALGSRASARRIHASIAEESPA